MQEGGIAGVEFLDLASVAFDQFALLAYDHAPLRNRLEASG